MILKVLFSITLILLYVSNITSQTSKIYIPVDIERAYTNGTRSYSGKSGSNYWQNQSDYKIDASFNPKTRLLEGKEQITYYNNSPDNLNQIVIKLYQDIYKKGNERDKNIDPRDLHNGTDIKKIAINDKVIDLTTSNIKREGTNMIIKLPKTLSSHKQIKLEIEWSFTLPKYSNIRMGTVDSTTFFIAYWFPQIAVYDDISQWEMFNYDGFHEFYNDYSNFEVNVSIPNDYIVWATGTLQNHKDLLEAKYKERYEASMLSDTIIHIINKEDIGQKVIKSEKSINTWQFKADNVSEFAFGLSNHYLWDATSLMVDSSTNRRISINTVSSLTSKFHNEAAQLAKKTINYLSFDFPKIKYPYPQMTIFEGFGGMEFPMITNIRPCETHPEYVFLVSHEIAHNYFPFYVGTNQIKHSWMDEGWAMLLPSEFQDLEDTGYYFPNSSVEAYSWYGATEMNVPLMTPSVYVTGYESAVASYYRSELAFYFLRDLLGDEIFNKPLKEYIERWNGKHPIPYDLFFTFEDVAKKDLTWYWKAWFFDSGYPDLAIKNTVITKDNVVFEIEKLGNIPVPVHLTFIYTDGTDDKLYKPVSVWENDNLLKIEQSFKSKELKKIILGNKNIPDAKPNNNIFEK